MSDFLARESELLGDEFSGAGATQGAGGDDFDFDRAASAFPDISLDGTSDIPSAPSAPHAGGGDDFGFDDFDAPKHTDVKVTGDDEIEKFEDQFPDIDVPVSNPPPPSQPTFGATPTFAPRPQPSAYAATPILTHTTEEDEPQVIKDWREKQAEEIKARDARSKEKRQETIARAEKSIDEFYENYNAKKERTIRQNKIDEEEFLSSLTDSLSAGTTWTRITSLIELENSQSKTLARAGPGTTDLTRFKEVLLRLKREGDSAPGAAGY